VPSLESLLGVQEGVIPSGPVGSGGDRAFFRATSGGHCRQRSSEGKSLVHRTFFHSFRGFHDLLRDKPSSFFMFSDGALYLLFP
jgi:hypothetical protein